MKNALAEVEEQPFKDQNRTGAAEDSEWLASQQTEDPTGDRCAQKTLQHTLHTWRRTVRELFRTGMENTLQTVRQFKSQSDLHVFCSIPQQPTESDGVCHSSQVNKQNGRQGLNVKCIGEVTDKERRFSFDVKYQTPTKPENGDTKGILFHTKYFGFFFFYIFL